MPDTGILPPIVGQNDPSNHLSARAKFYPSVQGLRGFSAFSVIFVHLYRMAQNGGILPGMSNAAELVLASLGHGVALFFIISGFVIPPSLMRHGDLKLFTTDRLLRIMPVFVAIHMLVFVVGPFIGYKFLRDAGLGHYVLLFISNLTFTALPLGLPLAQQNAWTLTYEWGFYIAIGAAWFAYSRGWGRALKWPAAAFAVVMCGLFTFTQYFAVGLAFAWWGTRGRPRWRMPVAMEALVIPVALVAFFGLGNYVANILAVPFGVVIFALVLQDGSLTSRFLCTRPMQFLGLISYSFYLIHPPIILALEIVSQRLVQHGASVSTVFPAFVVLSIIASLAAATISYYLIEVRLRLWLGARVRGIGTRRTRLAVAVV